MTTYTLPHTVTWDGSDQTVTIARSANQTLEQREEIAEFLSSRYPQHFPMYMGMSVDQFRSWVAKLADTYYVNGIVLVARRTGAKGVIAVGITKPTGKVGQTELVIRSTGGYGSDKVDDAIAKLLRSENASKGLKIGKERIETIVHFDETVF